MMSFTAGNCHTLKLREGYKERLKGTKTKRKKVTKECLNECREDAACTEAGDGAV